MDAFNERYEDASSSLAELPESPGCKLFQSRDLAEPFAHRACRDAAPPCPCRNIAVDTAGCGDLGAHADPHMALHGNLAADSDVILDGRGTGNADLGDDDAMPPDHHVVGDLDQVIDLRPLADHRIPARAAVDGGVGADLHVVLDDHSPDLRHLQMPLRSHGEAEAVLADAHTGMEDDPIADEGVGNGHVGGNRAVPTDLHLRTDHGMGPDQGAGSDFRMRADDGARIDPDPVFQPGRGMDEGARRDSRRGEGGFRPHRGREQEAQHLREDAIGQRSDDRDRVGGHLGGKARRDEAGGGTSGCQCASRKRDCPYRRDRPGLRSQGERRHEAKAPRRCRRGALHSPSPPPDVKLTSGFAERNWILS